MSNLNKISTKELIDDANQFLEMENLGTFVDDFTNLKKIFLENDKYQKNYEVGDFILENIEIINKEKLLYIIATRLKNIIQTAKTMNFAPLEHIAIDKMKNKYKKYLNALNGSKVEIGLIKKDNQTLSVKEFCDMNTLYGKKTDRTEKLKHNQKLLDDIDKDVKLNMMFCCVCFKDIADFVCLYGPNGNLFEYIAEKNTNRITGTTLEKVCEEFGDYSEKSMDYADLLIEESKKVIYDNADKIDIDKFLLVAAYHVKEVIENTSDLKDDFLQDYLNIMKVADKYIKNNNVKISGGMTSVYYEGLKNVEYSAKNLREDISRIVGDKYYSKKEISTLKENLLSGELPLDSIDNIQCWDLINLTHKEKMELANRKIENFAYLTMFDILDKEEIQEVIDNPGDKIFSIQLIDMLYENAYIEKSDMLRLYMNRNIDLSNIITINDLHDLQPEIDIQKLIEYYHSREKDEKSLEEFDRYSLLFREIKLKGKDKEKQAQMAEQIMEELYKTDSDYDKDLKELYKSNLLPIRTLIDWNGEQMIYELVKENSLKPYDAKALLMTGELSIPKTYSTILNSDLSDAEKMNFIFSSFDGIGETPEEINAQNDARMYLLNALNISKELGNIDKKSKTTRIKKGTGTIKGNQYIIDPVYRWQLLSEIDSEYDSKVYSDGTVAFILPNIKNGTVIIEKLYKSTQDGIKISYGSATYIMTQEEFYNNKSEIEINNKINRRKLTDMQKDKTADKYNHSLGWGKHVKENLGISVENGHSKEKIDKIDNLINRIEKARELVD